MDWWAGQSVAPFPGLFANNWAIFPRRGTGEGVVVPSSVERPSALDALCAWLAFGVPLAVTLWRIPPGAAWDGDLGVISALDVLPVLGRGALSTWLSQPFVLLPLGGRDSRVVIVAAFGVALAGWLVYRLSHDLLARNALTPRLSPLLALAGAILASLSPAWQCQGTIAGGSTVAAALVVGLVALRGEARANDVRAWALAGILSALAIVENLAAGIVAAALLGAEFLGTSESRSWRSPLAALGAFLASLLLQALPALMCPLVGRQWLELGEATPAAFVSIASERHTGVQSFVGEQGLLVLTVAAVGALVVSCTPPMRRFILPWLLIVVGALLFGGAEGPSSSGTLGSLPALLATSGVAIAAPLGVQSLALGLARAKIPLAGPASALLVACFFALSLVNAEESGRRVEVQRAWATQLWTDEALASLPAGAVLLVRAPEVVWRLWAARAASGEREDVVVVPLPLLERGAIAADLLQREPALAHLMRDIAVTGRVSEFAMSSLADVRPLFIDVGTDWDSRLLEHLVPRSLWIEFAPHALGRSDRGLAMREGRSAFERVLGEASQRRRLDARTLGVLARRAKERAVVHGALGDRDALELELRDLETMGAEPGFVGEVRRRLTSRPKGAIDIGGLLVAATERSAST